MHSIGTLRALNIAPKPPAYISHEQMQGLIARLDALAKVASGADQDHALHAIRSASNHLFQVLQDHPAEFALR